MHLFFTELDKSHLPNIMEFEGVLDLFSLCNAIELLNVTYFHTYGPQGIATRERLQFIHARSKARSLIEWFWAHFDLVKETSRRVSNSQDQVYWKYLAQQTKALVHYKRRAESVGMRPDGDAPFTWEDLDAQVKRCFEGSANFWGAFAEVEDDCLTFAWAGSRDYKVERRKHPRPGQSKECN